MLEPVVVAYKRFTAVTCGEPGSLHDRKVLRKSIFNSTVKFWQLFPNDAPILGDSAHSATSWLVAPLKTMDT